MESPERFSTLIHEVLHTLSAGYLRDDYQDLQGWEEGVVERVQRLFRESILTAFNAPISADTFHLIDTTHAYNGFIEALERLRSLLGTEKPRHILSCSFTDAPAGTSRLSDPQGRRTTRHCPAGFYSRILRGECDLANPPCPKEFIAMTPFPNPDEERNQVLNLVLDARTKDELRRAKSALHHWMQTHPGDTGMWEAAGGLSLLQEIVEEQEAEARLLPSVERVA